MGAIRVPLIGKHGAVRAYVHLDADDVGRVLHHRWYLGSDGYPRARVSGRWERMHRVVMRLTPGDGHVVDHANRDRLDNRKANLRLVTPAENAWNRDSERARLGEEAKALSVNIAPGERIKGVTYDTSRDRWRARVFKDGKMVDGGYHKTQEDAARVVTLLRQRHG